MFEEAVKRSMPLFLTEISSSTPSNSSPYLASEEEFVAALSAHNSRATLLHQLQLAWRKAERVVDLSCTLVGGSFLDLSIGTPKDIDVVIFYSAPKAREFRPHHLQFLQNEIRALKVDARLIPVDSAPWLTVKMSVFFTTLYMSQRGTNTRTTHGLVLVAHQLSLSADHEQ